MSRDYELKAIIREVAPKLPEAAVIFIAETMAANMSFDCAEIRLNLHGRVLDSLTI